MLEDNLFVKRNAYEMLQEDARYVYGLLNIITHGSEVDSNYMCMSMPYIGLFANEAEQWLKKVGLNAPSFTKEEKEYYSQLRLANKILEEGFNSFQTRLMSALKRSDDYFKCRIPIIGKCIDYDNVGVGMFNDNYCVNTTLVDMYIPGLVTGGKYSGKKQKEISVIAGKLAGYCGVLEKPVYKYKTDIDCYYDDYHFFKNTPLKKNDSLGFVLFSLLCGINFVTVFINNIFDEEIPQKLKFAYLQYYYLCDFIEDMNKQTGLKFAIDNRMKNREFRNCLAHYGLGQFMSKSDIIQDDLLKGLTQKAFNKDYYETKGFIYDCLHRITDDIGLVIF